MSLEAESLTLSEEDYWKLRRVIESKFVPARIQLRVRVLLGAAEGLSNHELAARFSVSRPTVIKWRRHYANYGLEGLLILRTRSDRCAAALRKELEIVNVSVSTYPRYAYCWTVHELARELHVSRATIQRTWKNYGITPQILEGAAVDPESLILSLDPFFGRRIIAVVGLYYQLWDHALAFAVDPQPWRSGDRLDGGPGLFESREIDALMATLKNVDAVMVGGNPQVADFLKFLNHLDERVAAEHEVHLVMQWYGFGVHRDASAQAWLSAHPRFQLHFMPRKLTWIRFVECWLDLIQASGRDTPLQKAKQLVPLLNEFVRNTQGKALVRGPLCIA